MRFRVWSVVAAALVGSFALAGQSQLSAVERGDEPAAIVTDAAGKDVEFDSLKWTAGARRLGWLADPKGATEDAKKGPLALEVREPHSTTFTKGVVTLLPVSSVRSIRYEYEKQLMAVSVNGLTEPVSGTLQYRGINVIGLEGDAGGVPAKYSGGVPGMGIKKVVFSGSKPLAARPSGGAAWAVQIIQPQANHPTMPARNLKPLFTFPGGVEVLLDAIPVRKGDPVALSGAGVKRLEVLAVDPNTQMAALEVQPDDGPERVIVVPLTLEQDKRTGTLVGLLGEVDAGWKLFPLHAIKVITSDPKK
jgi:hypothetical protein